MTLANLKAISWGAFLCELVGSTEPVGRDTGRLRIQSGDNEVLKGVNREERLGLPELGTGQDDS